MAEIKAYVDRDGRFLGQFDGNAPAGAFEVPEAPSDGRQIWDSRKQKWSDPPTPVDGASDGEVALEALRRTSDISDQTIEEIRDHVRRRKLA